MTVREQPYYFRTRELEKKLRPPALPPTIQVDSRVFPDGDTQFFDGLWGKFSDQPGDPDHTVQTSERCFYIDPEYSIRKSKEFYSRYFGLDRHGAWLKAVQDLRTAAQHYALLDCTWHYVGVYVCLIYQGSVIAEADLWGIESFATEYIAQVKRDLQDQLWADVLPSLFYAYA